MKIRFFLSSLTLFVFLTNTALAIEYSGTGGIPAFPREDNSRTESIFVHIAEPGTSIEDGIRVTNNSEEVKTLLVYPTDPAKTGEGGGFACKQFADANDNTGLWIKLKKSEVTLQPKTNKIIPFILTIPEDVEVGEYNACIAIQEKKEVPRDEKKGIVLGTRAAIRVVITIPGEITRELEIVEFAVNPEPHSGGKSLYAKANNTGNVSIDADIEIIVRDFLGRYVEKYGGEFPVLREETADWNFVFGPTSWGGWYNATLTIEYDENPIELGMENKDHILTRLEGSTIQFFVMPKTRGLIIEIIILIFILFNLLLILLKIKRKRWIKKTWVEYKIKQGDDMRKLANKYDIAWQLLAKGNKLSPPYSFQKGEVIKVPPLKKSKKKK